MSAAHTAHGMSDAAVMEALLHRARQGDLSAWADLVYRHQDIAYRMAYLLVRSTDDAGEVTRDALIRAYRALPSLRREQVFLPWLLRIIAAEARHRRREVGRAPYGARRDGGSTLRAGHGDGNGRGPEDGIPARHGGVSPAEAGGWPGYQQALAAAIDRLAEEDRLLIFCRHLLGMSEADAAQVLGVSADSMDERARAALRRLRERMASAGSG